MKRLQRALGPILALAGASGLVMFGRSLAGIFDVLTYRIVVPPEPLPAALSHVPWAAVSLATLTIGLVLSIMTTAARDRGRFPSLARLLCAGAGGIVMLGSLALVWAFIGLRADFQALARSASSPTAETVEAMLHSAETRLTIGGAVLVVSTALLLIGQVVGVPAGSSRPNERRALSRAATSVRALCGGAVLVGVVVSLLTLFLVRHGSVLETMLEAMIDGSAPPPQPTKLARHMMATLNISLLVSGGVGLLGLLQVPASLITAPADLVAESEK